MSKLSIIAITYNHTRDQLRSFISSIKSQTSDRWNLFIIHDGPGEETKENIKDYLGDPRISYIETKERSNDWGHALRSYALDNLDLHEYVMFQNCDNYLIPTCVEFCLRKAKNESLDIVTFNILHNYSNINGKGEPPYSVLNVHPHMNRCDAGSFIIKKDLARLIGWPKTEEIKDKIVQKNADGLFINWVMNTKPKHAKIESVLMVHN